MLNGSQALRLRESQPVNNTAIYAYAHELSSRPASPDLQVGWLRAAGRLGNVARSAAPDPRVGRVM